MKVGKIQISGFFYSNSEVIEDAQNLYAEITYDNQDVYKGTVRQHEDTNSVMVRVGSTTTCKISYRVVFTTNGGTVTRTIIDL